MARRRFAREPYQDYRSRMQSRWRPHILARDRKRCRCCGAKEDLEMAHITDCVAFSRAIGRKEGVTFSFRWDNLVMLCALCHAASSAPSPAGEELERKVRVTRFLEEIRRVRGWSSPWAVLPPDLVPPQLRPARSFHDVMRLTPLVPFPTFARYASDGGLVFQDLERLPGQARLTAPDVAAPA
ncbi:MAG: HNH endonuclease signature motif containing protein [Candidatus Thermoplasmatota archaeon]